MPQLNDREVLTISAAALRIGVSQKTIRRWMAAGWIDAIRTAGRGYLIYADTLTRAVPKRTASPQPGAPSLDQPWPPAA